MFEHRAFQWWYGWHAGVRRAAVRCLVPCLLVCAWVASLRTASALENSAAPLVAAGAPILDPGAVLLDPGAVLLDPGAVLCDPDAVASGNQIECERPAPPPVVPPDAGEAPMCDETGASVAARIVIPEVDRGRLEALPCELVLALFGGKKMDFPHASARWGTHRPPAKPTALTLARADAALALPLLMPERTEPHSLIDPLRTGLGACPGHLRPPYRPPLG